MNDAATNCLDVAVQPAAPGLFVLPGNHAAAINQDAKINSAQDVAPTGSIVSLFLTGLGTTTPATPDGSITPYPAPVQDLKISVVFTWKGYCFLYATSESAVADPPYAGPAPLEIEGLGQINVVVPSPPGPGPYGPPCYSKPVYIQGGPSVAIEVLPPGGGPPIVSPAVGISTN